MKIIGRGRLTDYCSQHANVRSQVIAWLSEAEDAEWKAPQDIKARYAHASFMADNRVVFNLKGNKYRLDTKVNYEHQTVLIMRIGTHAEYEKWDF